MVYTDKKQHTDFFKETIEYLKSKGFTNIKADLDGYDSPKGYKKKGTDIVITPDIVAEKDGKKHFFDLSLKTEKPKLLKSKWLFLDMLSQIKSCTFKIITTRGHYKFTDEMLSDISLHRKEPIKI